MENKKFGWKDLGVYFRAFLIVALAFLAIGLGTLGSVRTAGDAYELKTKGSGSLEPAVIFHLSHLEIPAKETEGDEPAKEAETVKLVVKQVYLNVAAIYAKPGVAATLRLGRSSSSAGTFSTRVEGSIANFYQALSDTEDVTAASEDAFYNWVAPFEVPEEGWKVDSYSYYKLTTTCNLLINEVVFVGEKLNGDGEPTGELSVVPAEIFSGKEAESGLTAGGDRLEDAAKKAALLLDAQQIPTLAQTSFFRFGPEEVAMLMNIRAMRDGGSYDRENIGNYYGDMSYNSLGLDLVALGTAIFGMSPFGLRFFPMLASFGVLVAGYFLVKRLFKSEKAGFAFALAYALSGVSLALGHLGTPLTIGLFFFVMSALLCHRFYAEGMAKARLSSALPLALSGLFAAAAISVNGAYVLPVAGVVALFVCGMLRQQKAKKYHLAKAAEEPAPEPVSEEPAESPAPAPEPAEQRVARVRSEYRYKNTVAPLLFGFCLLLGAVVIALLAALPASAAFVRLYDDPAAPALGVFGIAWKAFAAGFTGGTVMAAHSDFLFFYELFHGAGDAYAVTAAAINTVAFAAALAGVVYAVYRIVRLCLVKEWGKEERTELRAVAVPFVGLVLSLFTAIFAEGQMAFVLLSLVFALALFGGAAKRYTEAEGKLGKGYRIAAIVSIALLAAVFLLFAVFTFSIPLPASFMAKLF